MKLYHVKVIDRKTKEVLVDKEERGITKKRIKQNYTVAYRFHENMITIEVERLTRKPGVQIDIFKIIEEEENGNN